MSETNKIVWATDPTDVPRMQFLKEQLLTYLAEDDMDMNFEEVVDTVYMLERFMAALDAAND